MPHAAVDWRLPCSHDLGFLQTRRAGLQDRTLANMATQASSAPLLCSSCCRIVRGELHCAQCASALAAHIHSLLLCLGGFVAMSREALPPQQSMFQAAGGEDRRRHGGGRGRPCTSGGRHGGWCCLLVCPAALWLVCNANWCPLVQISPAGPLPPLYSIHKGRVVRIRDFGAFVEVRLSFSLPGRKCLQFTSTTHRVAVRHPAGSRVSSTWLGARVTNGVLPGACWVPRDFGFTPAPQTRPRCRLRKWRIMWLLAIRCG